MKTFSQIRQELNEGYESNRLKKTAIQSLSHGTSRSEHTGHEGMSRYHASMADEHKGTEAAKHHQRASDHHGRALAALRKGNLKGGLTHAKNAADAAAAANVAQGNKSASTRAGKADSLALYNDHKRETNFHGRAQARDDEYKNRDKPKRSDKPIKRLIGKAKTKIKRAFKSEDVEQVDEISDKKLDTSLYEMEMLTHKKKIAAAQSVLDKAKAAHSKASDTHFKLSDAARKKHGKDSPQERAHVNMAKMHKRAAQGDFGGSHGAATVRHGDSYDFHGKHVPEKHVDHAEKLHNNMVDAHHKLEAVKKASPLHKAKTAVHKLAKKVGVSEAWETIGRTPDGNYKIQRDSETGARRKVPAQMRNEETPTGKQVKQAIGIARDKRYAKGNMTGAVKTMNKINPKLSNHPRVKDELQKQNEGAFSKDAVERGKVKIGPSKARLDAIRKDHEAKKKAKDDAISKLRNEDKAADRDALQKAMDVFKKRGGKITKVAPGKAAGYHGKDDPGKDVKGMMDKGDTKAVGTRKKVKSMEQVKESVATVAASAKGDPRGHMKAAKAHAIAAVKHMDQYKETNDPAHQKAAKLHRKAEQSHEGTAKFHKTSNNGQTMMTRTSMANKASAAANAASQEV